MPRAYYNEHDPYAAQWLRNLIQAGEIAPGDVDERSIEDVKPGDLAGYTQCHFFAGIGVWSLALRCAGIPDDFRVWTGSCPCQPFSAAGKGVGFDDERHLWPAWHHLISQCQPRILFGEQVDAAVKHTWLDLVQDDLEGIGYAVGPACLPACSVGSPNIRQRLWYGAVRVADTELLRCDPRLAGIFEGQEGPGSESGAFDDRRCTPSFVGHTFGEGLERHCGNGHDGNQSGRVGAIEVGSVAEAGSVGGLGHTDDQRSGRDTGTVSGSEVSSGWGLWGRVDGTQPAGVPDGASASGPTNGFWRDADWLYCRDGKWRPVEPGSQPLVNGAPSRVGRLRAYGNAINAKVAEEFIRTFVSCIDSRAGL